MSSDISLKIIPEFSFETLQEVPTEINTSACPSMSIQVRLWYSYFLKKGTTKDRNVGQSKAHGLSQKFVRAFFQTFFRGSFKKSPEIFLTVYPENHKL